MLFEKMVKLFILNILFLYTLLLTQCFSFIYKGDIYMRDIEVVVVIVADLQYSLLSLWFLCVVVVVFV